MNIFGIRCSVGRSDYLPRFKCILSFSFLNHVISSFPLPYFSLGKVSFPSTFLHQSAYISLVIRKKKPQQMDVSSFPRVVLWNSSGRQEKEGNSGSLFISRQKDTLTFEGKNGSKLGCPRCPGTEHWFSMRMVVGHGIRAQLEKAGSLGYSVRGRSKEIW